MSDGEVEVEAPQGYPVLPKDVTQEIGSTKLFNKWSYEDVEIRDISLTYVYTEKKRVRRRWRWAETGYERGQRANTCLLTATTFRSGSRYTCLTPPAGTL